MKAVLTERLNKSAAELAAGAAAMWGSGTSRSREERWCGWSVLCNLILKLSTWKAGARKLGGIPNGGSGTIRAGWRSVPRQRGRSGKPFSISPFNFKHLAAPLGISRRAVQGRVGPVFLKYLPALMVMLVSACGGNPWNSPYPAADAEKIFSTAPLRNGPSIWIRFNLTAPTKFCLLRKFTSRLCNTIT